MQGLHDVVSMMDFCKHLLHVACNLEMLSLAACQPAYFEAFEVSLVSSSMIMKFVLERNDISQYFVSLWQWHHAMELGWHTQVQDSQIPSYTAFASTYS